MLRTQHVCPCALVKGFWCRCTLQVSLGRTEMNEMNRNTRRECFFVSNFLSLIWQLALKPSLSHVQSSQRNVCIITPQWCIAQVTTKRCSTTCAGMFKQRNLGPLVLIQYCLLHLKKRMFHWSNQNVSACVPDCEVIVGRRTRVIYGL